jgi:uncharacterized membrane protein YgaE (UPF0421/DUF939 family)
MDKNTVAEYNRETKKGIELLDFKIALTVVICLITSKLVPVIQYMPACFAAILCAQGSAKLSFKTGLTRTAVTLIGGVIGVGIVLLDNAIKNTWLFIAMAAAGIILTLLICKLLRLSNMPARIGCVTFILVIMVMNGEKRVEYAMLRVLGTIYGAIAAIIVSWGLSALAASSSFFLQFRPLFRDKVQ